MKFKRIGKKWTEKKGNKSMPKYETDKGKKEQRMKPKMYKQ